MALASSSLASPFSQAAEKEKNRRLAEFLPSIWDDHFMTLSHDNQKLDAWAARASELKEEVRAFLNITKGSEQIMELIDNLQRLGVAYHFEEEIEEALKLMYYKINDPNSPQTDHSDLHSTALRFRLLRQQGYRVPSDVFSKFVDHEGKFKEIIATDPNGMLSLYEAAFVGTQGEAILDEALAFTKKKLQLAIEHLQPPLAAKMRHALELPLRRRMHKLESRHYISLYHKQEGHFDKLLELAKLDYNLVQVLHKKELKVITRWWKELDFAKSLSFARDRVVECYMWAVAVFHEPNHSCGRVHVTKMIALISVIDDIYDVYGTLNELELFTEAIERWDLAVIDQLPDYMKVCYSALLGCVKAMEEDLAPEGNSRRVYYLIEEMKRLCREYLVEARWFNQGYTPTVDEYLRCSLISSTYPMIATLCYVGMGDEVPEELFGWLRSGPKIVDSTSRVGRLANDIVSNGFEQKRGHVASTVQCYMKEHGSSKEEACQKLREMVDVAWKDINAACLEPAPFPVPLLHRILNLARVTEVVYQYVDGYTFPNAHTEENIAAMFVNAIPV